MDERGRDISPVEPAPSTPYRSGRMWDALAYIVAMISLWPAFWLLIGFGDIVQGMIDPASNFRGRLTWRSFSFDFFEHPVIPASCLGFDAVSLGLGLLALAMTRRRRRDGHRFAQAAGRLGLLGLTLGLLVVAILLAMSFERFVR